MYLFDGLRPIVKTGMSFGRSITSALGLQGTRRPQSRVNGFSASDASSGGD